jgi:hypothetical protein
VSLLPAQLPADLPGWALPAATAAGLLLLTAVVNVAVVAAGRRTTPQAARQRGQNDGRLIETALTLAAAGIATAVAVTGMWRVFGDALGFSGPGRVALAGFLEIALMVSAIRARRNLRDTGSVGVDGAAVWAMAGLSAVLAAADAHGGIARAARFTAPLVAAWLWERGMAADRRAARPPQVRAPIAWRLTKHRLAVRLGLADPTQRAGSEVDRARRLARLTRARLRLAVLETTTLPRPLAWLTLRPVRRAHAAWRLQRHALAAVEHLHLGADPDIIATIASTVAAVIGLRDATTPAALQTANPWIHRPALAGSLAVPLGSDYRTTTRIVGSPTGPAEGVGSDSSDRPGHDSDRRTDPEAIDPAATADPVCQATDRIRATRPEGRVISDRAPLTARPSDVQQLREAIATGQLPARPAVDAVRRHLRISPSYARAARAAALAQPYARQTDGTPPFAPAGTAADSGHETAQPQGESDAHAAPEKPGITTEGLLIHYRPEKGQESNTSNGTHAVRLP